METLSRPDQFIPSVVNDTLAGIEAATVIADAQRNEADQIASLAAQSTSPISRVTAQEAGEENLAWFDNDEVVSFKGEFSDEEVAKVALLREADKVAAAAAQAAQHQKLMRNGGKVDDSLEPNLGILRGDDEEFGHQPESQDDYDLAA